MPASSAAFVPIGGWRQGWGPNAPILQPRRALPRFIDLSANSGRGVPGSRPPRRGVRRPSRGGVSPAREEILLLRAWGGPGHKSPRRRDATGKSLTLADGTSNELRRILMAQGGETELVEDDQRVTHDAEQWFLGVPVPPRGAQVAQLPESTSFYASANALWLATVAWLFALWRRIVTRTTPLRSRAAGSTVAWWPAAHRKWDDARGRASAAAAELRTRAGHGLREVEHQAEKRPALGRVVRGARAAGRALHRLGSATRQHTLHARQWLLAAALCLLLALAAPGIVQLGEALPHPERGAAVELRLPQEELRRLRVLDAARSSVVYVSGEPVGPGDVARASGQPAGEGATGWVFDGRGHVVTSLHSVRLLRQGTLSVRYADQSVVPARLLGLDKSSDLAVLEVLEPAGGQAALPRPLPQAPRTLRLGQDVYVLGRTSALDHTVVRGTVSSLGRSLPAYDARPVQGAVATDAVVDQGNSGGPLLDSCGRVVGMATSAAAPSQPASPGGASPAPPGLAIPVDAVARSVNGIIAHGRVLRPSLGLGLGQEGLAEQLGVRLGGAVIVEVAPGSPAHTAGLRVGDVLVKLDGKPLHGPGDALAALEDWQPGQTVRLSVLRPADADAAEALLPTDRHVDVELPLRPDAVG